MAELVLAILGALFAVFVVFWAVLERRWADSARARLVATGVRVEVRRAFDELLAARAAFGASVIRFEAAVAAAPVPSGASGSTGVFDAEVNVRFEAKDCARDRLLAADAAWQRIRPTPTPRPDLPDWLGVGVVSTWGFGVIGHERAFVRVEHAFDPHFWSIVEARRWRVGLGIGWEQQRLSLVGVDAEPLVLLDLIHHAFDDTDAAFRPGFAPARAFRALLRGGAVRRVHHGLQRWATVDLLRRGLSDEERARVRGLLQEWSDLRTGEPTLRVSIAGPGVMFGVWTGWRRPDLYLLSSSGQQAWDPESTSDSIATNRAATSESAAP